MLELAGLEAREERAYRELVRLPAASAGDLAELLAVDTDEIGVVLAALEAKGLVSQAPGPERKFRATAPERAFGPLLLQHRQHLAAVESAVGRLADEYRSRTALRGAGELVEVIYGAPAIGRQIEQMQRAARAEVRWLVKPPTVAVFAEDNAAQLAAMSTGVHYRAIYELSLLELPGDPHGIAAGAANGEESRVLPELPVKMVVADRDLAIVPVAPTETPDEPSAIVVHASGLLNALIALFEQLWDAASPLLFTADGAMQQERAADGPSAADLHLLSLIVAGLTDHAIAAQLGMSTRTVQRRIRVLLELTGVQTRLQLVWQAARRGWL
jgi:DNA-binding CsgD family transcriptional regulator